MGYFLVRYNSRVVIYDRKLFIRLATVDVKNISIKRRRHGNPGQVAMGGAHVLKVVGSNPSIVPILDGHVSHAFVVMFVRKYKNK